MIQPMEWLGLLCTMAFLSISCAGYKKTPLSVAKSVFVATEVKEPQYSLIETCQSNFDEGDIIYDPLLQKNLVRRSNKWVVEEEKVEA